MSGDGESKVRPGKKERPGKKVRPGKVEIMALRIVTDSASDFPADLFQQWNVTVVPAYVIVDDVSYLDGIDISADEFYRRLVSASRLPTTSQPTAADFETVYRDLLEQGHQILSIHVSAKLSGTLNSAQQAKAALGDDAPIEIVDSQLASLPMGLAVLDAAQSAESHETLNGLADAVRSRLDNHQAYFVLDTLEYLAKGGRVGKAAAFLGSFLSVKPILTLQDGEVHPVERPRTMAKALPRLIDLVSRNAPLERIAVIYSTDLQAAERLQNDLMDLAGGEDIAVARFSPALGVYVGPNALGIAFTRSTPSDGSRG